MKRWFVEDTVTSALMRVMALVMGGTEESYYKKPWSKSRSTMQQSLMSYDSMDNQIWRCAKLQNS
jgi:hypothetical protein